MVRGIICFIAVVAFGQSTYFFSWQASSGSHIPFTISHSSHFHSICTIILLLVSPLLRILRTHCF